jgi:uncharacterized SAM-binding protein YcdF (DUF218 family)
MYGFLSKLCYFILSFSPLYWLGILLVFTFLIRKRWLKTTLRIVCIVFIVAVSTNFIVDKMIAAWLPKPAPLQKGEVYETGILLGGFVSFDDKVKPKLNTEHHRFEKAIELYKEGYIKKLIISSGAGRGKINEAEYAKKLAVANGVPEADIITETLSKNTYENAVFTRLKLDSMHVYNHSLLISSAMHLRRARQTFEKAGISVIEYPSDYGNEIKDKQYTATDYIFLNLNAATKCQWLLKEVFGFAAYAITGK